MLQGEELRNLIHDVAEEIRQRDDVKEIADQMETMLGTRLFPIEVPSGLGLPALVEHLRRGNRPPGQPWKSHRFYKIGDTIIHEMQGSGNEYNAYVSLGGASQYPKISSVTLNNIMQDTGYTDAQLAAAMRDSIRGKELPGQLQKYTAKLNRLKLLLFGREAIRNTGLIAFTPMILSLIASDKDDMTWQEALASYETTSRLGRRGVFPMSMENAQAAAAELEIERLTSKERERTLQTPLEPRRSRHAQELANREIELATRWLAAIMKAEGLTAFNDREHAKIFITSKIVEFYVGRQRRKKS
ncbi:hypothetical protein CAL7716_054100 [Calothrix sp. PCC 7716]|nr:hypothetical protein CAL7716_054100 [Calothrix sp. PCC 7716]